MSAIELTMDDVARDATAVHAWLRAHDLDPDRTVPGVVIRDGLVTATLLVLDPDGSRSFDRDPLTGEILGRKTAAIELTLRAPVPAGLGTVIE